MHCELPDSYPHIFYVKDEQVCVYHIKDVHYRQSTAIFKPIKDVYQIQELILNCSEELLFHMLLFTYTL